MTRDKITYLSKTLSTKIPNSTLADLVEAKIVSLCEELACLYGNKLGLHYDDVVETNPQRQGLAITWKRFYEVKKK